MAVPDDSGDSGAPSSSSGSGSGRRIVLFLKFLLERGLRSLRPRQRRSVIPARRRAHRRAKPRLRRALFVCLRGVLERRVGERLRHAVALPRRDVGAAREAVSDAFPEAAPAEAVAAVEQDAVVEEGLAARAVEAGERGAARLGAAEAEGASGRWCCCFG